MTLARGYTDTAGVINRDHATPLPARVEGVRGCDADDACAWIHLVITITLLSRDAVAGAG